MRIRLLWRAILFLLIAAVVIAIGTSSGKPVGPDAGAGSEPTTAELASRAMLGLADAADRLAAGSPAPGSMPESSAQGGGASPGLDRDSGAPAPASDPPDAGTAAELQAIAAMLHDHVALLTPGQPQSDGEPDSPDGGQPTLADSSPDGSQPTLADGYHSGSALPATPMEVATALADSGNRLIMASLETEPAAVRATLGVGLEQRLAAAELATEAAGLDAAGVLPDPDLPTVAEGWKAASGVVLEAGSCPSGDAARAARTATGSAGSTGPPPEGAARAAGRAVAGSADAAFRLAYAYQLAAARLGAAHSAPAWAAAADSEELGRRLVTLLPKPCAALRRPAYQLPADFTKHPMASAAAGEEQLAGLLRDAAAAAPTALRAPLVRAAWDAARASLHRTGALPALA